MIKVIKQGKNQYSAVRCFFNKSLNEWVQIVVAKDIGIYDLFVYLRANCILDFEIAAALTALVKGGQTTAYFNSQRKLCYLSAQSNLGYVA